MVFLLKYFRTVSETVWEQVFQVFLRPDLQTCFHCFLIYGLLIFLEYLRYIFFWSCSPKGDWTWAYCWKIFPSLLRKKILFSFDFGERFYLEKDCFSQPCYSREYYFRDIVKFYPKVFLEKAWNIVSRSGIEINVRAVPTQKHRS